MIQSLNDIQKFNEHAEYANATGEAEYTLIYDGHDLAELFYESKKGRILTAS